MSLSDPVRSQVVPRVLRVDAVRFRRGQCLSPGKLFRESEKGEQSKAEGVCLCRKESVVGPQ